MHETSLSLLNRLQNTQVDGAWEQLHDVYNPLIHKWLIDYGVQPHDADDLSQDVLMAVSRDIEKFDHSGRKGAFRAWLKGILVNRLRNYWRARDRRPTAHGGSDLNRRLNELDDPASQITQIWNREHDQHVIQRLMRLAEPQFESKTWAAFRKVTLEGAKPTEVAKELEISLNAVFIAKSRVLRRLREHATGLVESSTQFFPNG